MGYPYPNFAYVLFFGPRIDPGWLGFRVSGSGFRDSFHHRASLWNRSLNEKTLM